MTLVPMLVCPDLRLFSRRLPIRSSVGLAFGAAYGLEPRELPLMISRLERGLEQDFK
jgi:hypothetical protein